MPMLNEMQSVVDSILHIVSFWIHGEIEVEDAPGLLSRLCDLVDTEHRWMKDKDDFEAARVSDAGSISCVKLRCESLLQGSLLRCVGKLASLLQARMFERVFIRDQPEYDLRPGVDISSRTEASYNCLVQAVVRFLFLSLHRPGSQSRK